MSFNKTFSYSFDTAPNNAPVQIFHWLWQFKSIDQWKQDYSKSKNLNIYTWNMQNTDAYKRS